MSRKSKKEQNPGASISKAEALASVDDAFLCAKALDGWTVLSAKELEKVSRHEDNMETWKKECYLTCLERQEELVEYLPESIRQSVENKVRGWQFQAKLKDEYFKRADAQKIAESARRLEYTAMAFFGGDYF